MVTIDIDGKRVWPIPSRHAAIIIGATKNEDGSITYQYTPLQPGTEHTLLVRMEPDEVKEILRARQPHHGGGPLPTNEEIVGEIERRIAKSKKPGKPGKG